MATAQAIEAGNANRFEAVPTQFPWLPQLAGSDGRSHAKPTAFGAQSAIVIGPDGVDTPSGADELYCNRLGPARILFHWQDSGDASCWVRVAQRSAGGGLTLLANDIPVKDEGRSFASVDKDEQDNLKNGVRDEAAKRGSRLCARGRMPEENKLRSLLVQAGGYLAHGRVVFSM